MDVIPSYSLVGVSCGVCAANTARPCGHWRVPAWTVVFGTDVVRGDKPHPPSSPWVAVNPIDGAGKAGEPVRAPPLVRAGVAGVTLWLTVNVRNGSNLVTGKTVGSPRARALAPPRGGRVQRVDAEDR